MDKINKATQNYPTKKMTKTPNDSIINLSFILKLNNKKQVTENFKKNQEETIVINYNKYKFTKDVAPNRRIKYIIEFIEKDGGVKLYLINAIKNNIDFLSHFQLNNGLLSGLFRDSKEILFTLICLIYPFFKKSQKKLISDTLSSLLKNNNTRDSKIRSSDNVTLLYNNL